MTSGFVGTPYPPNGKVCETQDEAWAFYQANSTTYGYPIRIAPDRWLVPKPQPIVNEILARQARGLKISAPPTPGSAAKKAQVKAEDRKRISDRQAKLAAKRQAEAERAAEEERRRRAQGTLNI